MDKPASNDEPTADTQTTDLLKARVQRLGLAWFPDHLGDDETSRRLVIGLAAWSIYDVRLLTCVRDAIVSRASSDFRVAIFDVDELPSSGELQRIFPGIGEVFHTPVAGYWVAGQLMETASGFAARQLIGRLLGFDPKSGLERITAG